MGVAFAEFQNSGEQLKNAQWNEWQQKEAAIRTNERSGLSCDHWHRYEEDIFLIKELGCNACRFSLDWSAIEPTEGLYDQSAITHYHAELDALLAAGITPMVTLHHFVHPNWFEKKGGFERLENLHHFISFCQKVFQEYQEKAKLWCTINEPGPYVFQGYINGVFPPGKSSPGLAGTVLRNMLVAHLLVYQALKAMPGGSNSSIGLVHQYMTFEPKNNANFLESAPCLFLNYMFNDVILRFLKTGQYSFGLSCYYPLVAHVSLDDTIKEVFPELQLPNKYSGDFIGLNYYSRIVIEQKSFNLFSSDFIVPSCKEGEIMTDMPYPLYAAGLYEAIKTLSCLQVPIYITENGIADAQDNRRKLFFKEYLGELSRALEDGYDVRGWFYWTLMDNFEWNEGFSPRFGLYEVNFQTGIRTLRTSALFLKDLLCTYNNAQKDTLSNML